MTIAEEIASKSAKLPIARQHEVLDFVEFVGQRCRHEIGESADEERRKSELLRRGREIIDRVRQRTAHLTEDEAERLVDEAITEYRQGKHPC